jgi:hypothetical protein
MTGPDGAPRLRVVRGQPTAEEIAALAAVLTARSAGSGPATTGRGGWQRDGRLAWDNRSALVRPPLHRGPDAWRASARPR